MKFLQLIVTLFLVTAVTACSGQAQSPSADTTRANQTAEAMAEATRQVPAPGIVNWQELRFATFLYELRDQEIATFSYYTNFDGDRIFLCESVGFGIPASVQITNPERVLHSQSSYQGGFGAVTIPQPEPNGLFMPEGLAATYVLCSDGNGGIAPMYVEQEIIVSPIELTHIGDARRRPTTVPTQD